MNSVKRHNLVRRVNEIAPILSIALLLVLPYWFQHDPRTTPIDGPQQAAVAAAVDRMPYRIGSWAGRDIDVPTAAVEMLRPNALQGRKFTNLEENRWIDLMFVHCGDARDMLGHYPPVCYPAAGWMQDEVRSGSSAAGGEGKAGLVELTVKGQRIKAAHYRFSQLRDWGDNARIQIVNFFVLPEGQITHDLDRVRRRTNWLGASVHGVAQVQFLFDGGVSVEEAARDIEELLGGMTEILTALGVREPAGQSAGKQVGDGGDRDVGERDSEGVVEDE